MGIEENEIELSSTFVENLGADSLDVVELVMAFEEEFEIEIPDDVIYKLGTVEDVVSFVENPEPILNAVELDRARLEQIADRVKKIIAAQLGIDAEKIKGYSTWAALGADSLDLVELVMAFEEEFNVEIPDYVAEKVETVGAAVETIFYDVYGYQAPYSLIQEPEEEEEEDARDEDNETDDADEIVDAPTTQIEVPADKHDDNVKAKQIKRNSREDKDVYKF